MTFYGEKYLKNLLISDIFRTFANEHLDVSIGVRLALYAEVAARCCWSWATGYMVQLLII